MQPKILCEKYSVRLDRDAVCVCVCVCLCVCVYMWQTKADVVQEKRNWKAGGEEKEKCVCVQCVET